MMFIHEVPNEIKRKPAKKTRDMILIDINTDFLEKQGLSWNITSRKNLVLWQRIFWNI
jgi:hypothetical protein